MSVGARIGESFREELRKPSTQVSLLAMVLPLFLGAIALPFVEKPGLVIYPTVGETQIPFGNDKQEVAARTEKIVSRTQEIVARTQRSGEKDKGSNAD